MNEKKLNIIYPFGKNSTKTINADDLNEVPICREDIKNAIKELRIHLEDYEECLDDDFILVKDLECHFGINKESEQ